MRHLLMASASRMAFAPETDEGHEYADADDTDALDDEVDDDEVDGDEAGGAADRVEDDDDGADEGDEDGPAEVAAKPSRGSARFAALSERARVAEAAAEETRRELAAIRQERAQQQAERSQAQEAERLAMMDPEERAEYRIAQAEQRMQNRLNQIQFDAADSADKTAFESMCNRNPAVAALKDEVEEALKVMRSRGTTAPRETVAAYLLGQKALHKAPRAKTAGAKAAAAGRDRQGVRAPSGRGDVPSGGPRKGNEAAQRRARLENIEL